MKWTKSLSVRYLLMKYSYSFISKIIVNQNYNKIKIKIELKTNFNHNIESKLNLIDKFINTQVCCQN